MPLTLLRHTVSCSVCDSGFIRELIVSVTPNVLEALPDALFTFRVDGEAVVEMTLAGAASIGQLKLLQSIAEKLPLFQGVGINTLKRLAKSSDFQGYMLPNNTLLEVSLEGVPSDVPEGGITVELPLATYTIRGIKSREIELDREA